MSKNIDIQEEDNEVVVLTEQDWVAERYSFLLNEQPQLQGIEPKKGTTTLLGGCVGSLIPVYMDYVNPFEDAETLVMFVVACFLFGMILTNTIGTMIREIKVRKALVKNLELLQNWVRPIIILPESPSDYSVDMRAKEISGLLNDEKCLNPLHTAIEDAEISFAYSIAYGFNRGETMQTNVGLPVVGLFPELFVLRGASDEKTWYEFQSEAVRIALELDSAFAKQWFALESEKYRSIAGGQFIG